MAAGCIPPLPHRTGRLKRFGDDDYRQEWTLQHLPVLIHEYQHSVDHLGTVAGRRLLDTLLAGLLGLSKKLQGDISGLTAGVGNFMRLRDSFGLLDFERMSKLGTVQGPMALPHAFLSGNQVAVSQMPIVDMKSQEVLVNASTMLHRHLDELLGACR